MNIFKLLFELFVIYILYKFIFEFIIPIYNTTKQVKQKMNDLHQHMQQNQEDVVNNKNTTAQTSAAPKKTAHEDYIDYEEIK
jgi:predicted Holliday junction resolvase-like endonuclease